MTLKVRYALAGLLAVALVLALATIGYLQRDTSNRLKVTATAYTSHPDETSGDPYLAAWNNRLTPGEKSIAVSRDLIRLGLTNGTEVKIEGMPGTYTVRDKMNKRWRRRIDIYMGNDRERALEWGKQKVVLSWAE
jgi:3D (Asp-Asp-Asp) domain-containing protein